MHSKVPKAPTRVQGLSIPLHEAKEDRDYPGPLFVTRFLVPCLPVPGPSRKIRRRVKARARLRRPRQIPCRAAPEGLRPGPACRAVGARRLVVRVAVRPAAGRLTAIPRRGLLLSGGGTPGAGRAAEEIAYRGSGAFGIAGGGLLLAVSPHEAGERLTGDGFDASYGGEPDHRGQQPGRDASEKYPAPLRGGQSPGGSPVRFSDAKVRRADARADRRDVPLMFRALPRVPGSAPGFAFRGCGSAG